MIKSSGSSLLLHDAIRWYTSLYLYTPPACFLTQSVEVRHDETFRCVSCFMFTVLLFIFYARLNVRMFLNVAFYTISLNCCLHRPRALQLFLHFYQVFYVQCNNKFGMQYKHDCEFGLFTVMLLRWVGHCCPLQPEQRTTTAPAHHWFLIMLHKYSSSAVWKYHRSSESESDF